MTVLISEGSVKRLRFGALIANFSIPLMLISLYGLFQLTTGSVWSYLAIALLGIGFSLSPVAHVAFYHVGIASQTAYRRSEGKVCSDLDAKFINQTLSFLDVTWRTAIILTTLGWLFYSFAVLAGQTHLSNYFALFTPLFGSFIVLLTVEKLQWGCPYLNGAALNMALTVFLYTSFKKID